ncbi:hypothetical protein BDN72DRAFT_148508 [Pluteus cervinus]|uniref:Uncharacterized protein n=1 Tax=Pluteus cervinus TaxID=181527 RepID=A0ACD3AKY5_9AGAR|nr:hypothetical protein BDN72DRAFT_148508 [Pluteus cervinus]
MPSLTLAYAVTSNMSLLTTPIEIRELILGQMDRTSLSAMALTCKAFREASQRHFFSMIYISTSDELNHLYLTFKDNTRLYDFVRFLSLSEMGFSDWLRRPHTIKLLMKFLPQFHRLTSFEIFISGNPRWNDLPNQLQHACLLLFHASPSLERLILPSNVWDVPLDLFSHCADLQSIHLSQTPHDESSHLDFDLPKSPWPPRLHRPKRLALWLTAHLSNEAMEPTATHLIGPSMGLDLQHLQFLSICVEGTSPDLNPLFQISLKNLLLDIDEWDDSNR